MHSGNKQNSKRMNNIFKRKILNETGKKVQHFILLAGINVWFKLPFRQHTRFKISWAERAAHDPITCSTVICWLLRIFDRLVTHFG